MIELAGRAQPNSVNEGSTLGAGAIENIEDFGPELGSEPFVDRPHMLDHRQIPVAEARVAEAQFTR
jgi:hypothetical protein